MGYIRNLFLHLLPFLCQPADLSLMVAKVTPHITFDHRHTGFIQALFLKFSRNRIFQHILHISGKSLFSPRKIKDRSRQGTQ